VGELVEEAPGDLGDGRLGKGLLCAEFLLLRLVQVLLPLGLAGLLGLLPLLRPKRCA